MKSQTLRVTSIKTRAGSHPSPVLYVSHSCGGNSGGRSLSSEWQFSDTLKKAKWTNKRKESNINT